MTTTPDTRVHATLTDEQLAAVVDLAATEPIEAIVLAWRCIDPDWDHREPRSVTPWHFTIPRDQWNAVCTALAAYKPLGSIAAVNLALDWMNVGPSVREDDQ